MRGWGAGIVVSLLLASCVLKDPGDDKGQGGAGGTADGTSGSTNVQAGEAATDGGVGANGNGGNAVAGGKGPSGGVAGQLVSAGTGGDGETVVGGADGTAGAAGAGPEPLAHFSFFVTSLAAVRKLSGSQDGFGGDLRNGKATGLAGADSICSTIAEESMPGSSAKGWRAFLSTVAGPVHAKDRIGAGPWYDRTGRLVAMNLADLLSPRPTGGDAAIVNDLPNEVGVPNHQPDAGSPAVDNHDVLTGSTVAGLLDAASLGNTCNDWTSKVGSTGKPRIGHSWSTAGAPNWISAHAAGGCAPGVFLVEMGGPQQGNTTVGAGGGYGAIYCFALQP